MNKPTKIKPNLPLVDIHWTLIRLSNDPENIIWQTFVIALDIYNLEQILAPENDRFSSKSYSR
jgi:hypothetical protein